MTPTNAAVAYVRAFLPGHEGVGETNGMVSSLYTIAAATVTTADFPGTIIPGRPTAGSLAMNVLSPADLQAYFEYGTQPGVYSSQTAVTNLTADEPVFLELSGLPANTRCYYRLRFKYTGETSYRADAERTFQTHRAPGSTFTFDIQSDSHIFEWQSLKI